MPKNLSDLCTILHAQLIRKWKVFRVWLNRSSHFGKVHAESKHRVQLNWGEKGTCRHSSVGARTGSGGPGRVWVDRACLALCESIVGSLAFATRSPQRGAFLLLRIIAL